MAQFSVRDFPSITAALVAQMAALVKEITDYTEGAAGRSLLESVASELQRQDVAVFQGVREGIEIGTYKNFDFFRLPAVFATGKVRYTRTNTTGSFTVPHGHQVRVPGSQERLYEVVSDTVMAPGIASVDVSVRCMTAGRVGNTPANTIVELVTPLDTFTVTNAQPFLTGLDQESDDDRRARFRLFIQGISKGTKSAIEFAARSTVLSDSDGNVLERVTGALVREPFLDSIEGMLGVVEVYIDNGSGSTSDALKQRVIDTIRGFVDGDGVIQKGFIAAGIDLNVYKVSAVPIPVECQTTIQPGFVAATVRSAVQAAITAYLQGLQVFETAIYAELVAAAMSVDGVADVVFTTPTVNVSVVFNQRIVSGVVTVN